MFLLLARSAGLELPDHAQCALDVFRLRGLVAAGEQQVNRFRLARVVQAVTQAQSRSASNPVTALALKLAPLGG